MSCIPQVQPTNSLPTSRFEHSRVLRNKDVKVWYLPCMQLHVSFHACISDAENHNAVLSR